MIGEELDSAPAVPDDLPTSAAPLFRLIGRAIERAVIEHEERCHGRAPTARPVRQARGGLRVIK